MDRKKIKVDIFIWISPSINILDYRGILLSPWCEFAISSELPNSFSTADATLMLYQALRTLQEIHLAGVLHLDIKPGNILLSNEMKNIIIVDFGLSKTFTTSSSGAKMSVAGTIPYKPANIKLSRKYDVHALGLTFLELIMKIDGNKYYSNLMKQLKSSQHYSAFVYDDDWEKSCQSNVLTPLIMKLCKSMTTPNADFRLDTNAAILQLVPIIQLNFPIKCLSVNLDYDSSNYESDKFPIVQQEDSIMFSIKISI